MQTNIWKEYVIPVAVGLALGAGSFALFGGCELEDPCQGRDYINEPFGQAAGTVQDPQKGTGHAKVGDNPVLTGQGTTKKHGGAKRFEEFGPFYAEVDTDGAAVDSYGRIGREGPWADDEGCGAEPEDRVGPVSGFGPSGKK